MSIGGNLKPSGKIIYANTYGHPMQHQNTHKAPCAGRSLVNRLCLCLTFWLLSLAIHADEAPTDPPITTLKTEGITPTPTQSTPRKVYLTNGDWPPYLSKDLYQHGFVSHIVSKAFKTQNIDVQYGFFPWKRAYTLAQQADPWVGSVVWSAKAEREIFFHYSDPILPIGTVFFHLTSKPLKWETYADLKGLTIGTTASYTYGAAFEAAQADGVFSIEEVPNEVLNLSKLLANRIDLIPMGKEVGYQLMREHKPEQVSMITHHPKFIKKVDYHLIINKQADAATALIAAFNKGLEALKASKEYDKIMDNEKEGFYKTETPPTTTP